MKKQILLLCLALISLCGYAQQITVKGVVTSATDQQPLIGTTVQVKGTGTGTITGIDGDYTLPNVDKNAVLVFSSIGFESQEIAVGGRTTINVVLKEAAELLDEVVVIGYGAVKKSDLTSSIATVKGDEITETVTGNAMDALQGKVNGVQVTSGGGPGATPKVLIRGVTTVNGTNPLYVVDGMPVGDNINFLNSNDIASMEVLKDASAAAIYGSRAANGVVLVTTKSGKTGKVSVSLDIYAGFQNVTKKMDLMNAQEFVEFSREAFNNNYISKVPGASASDPLSMRPSGNRYRYPAIYDDAAYIASLGAGTDWQDEIFRTSPVQNYQLTVTGGDEKTKYMFSAGYFNQQGVVINSDYERFSARAKIDSELNSWLKLGVNLAPTYMNANKTTQGHWASDGVINAALATSPVVPVYNEDGTWASQSMYAVASDGLTGVPNAVALTHIHN